MVELIKLRHCFLLSDKGAISILSRSPFSRFLDFTKAISEIGIAQSIQCQSVARSMKFRR